jgi:GNAT superfamily N-acetyltransferase
VTVVRTRTQRAHVADLDDELANTLRQLTLKGDGSYPYALMQPKFDELRRSGHRSEAYATWVKDVDGNVVGWCLTFRNHSREWETYFYVRPEMRRSGVGTKLYKSTKRRFGRIYVNRWDSTSTWFFDRMESSS